MTVFVECLKRLYQTQPYKVKLTADNLLKKGKLTQTEYDYILGKDG